MTCCGQKRAALAVPPRPRQSAVTSTPAADSSVLMRYVRERQIALVGAVSGRAYRFVPGAATEIDAADATALLATGRFVRA